MTTQPTRPDTGLAADLDWIRSQFPALSLEVNGHPAAYFDGPGGTQTPRGVIDAVAGYLEHSNANLHGAFETSRRSDEVVAGAHEAMADLLGCDAEEVVFGANMTSLTFAFSRAIGRALGEGAEIVVTLLDHDANFAPWRALEEHGVKIRAADIRRKDCTLDTEGLLALLNRRTRLVAVCYASNSVGSLTELERIIPAAHNVGAWVYVDAVHQAPHGPIDVRALDCDFLACSAYKFFGPHVGAVYGKAKHLKRLRPYKVRPAPDHIPDRWETGTQNHEGLAGVTAAIGYLAGIGRRVLERSGAASPAPGRRGELLAAMQAIRAYERSLLEKLVPGLLEIPGLTFYGIREKERFGERAPTVSIRMEGSTPRELAEFLAGRGLFVWDGHYYALNLAERLGVASSGGMVRIGLLHYNTEHEVERLLEALREFAARR